MKQVSPEAPPEAPEALEIMVPFRPIIEEREKPFAMLEDLWIKHREWVFEPLYSQKEAERSRHERDGHEHPPHSPPTTKSR